MKALTPRQRQILDFIRDSVAQHGVTPTREEICQRMGFRSPNAAQQHLKLLERKGHIELVPGKNRNIRLREAGLNAVSGLPIVGRVAAGAPILAQAHVEDHVQMDPQLFKPLPDYLLRVQGMSMRDAGILDGDLLAVQRQPEAQSGQIVVARLGDEVTVKRLDHGPNGLRLLAANPDFPPIDVDPSQVSFSLEGIAVGVVRRHL
ncbi:MAG: transcriptional repressor LexA [Candidatus Competibacterales bacterium]